MTESFVPLPFSEPLSETSRNPGRVPISKSRCWIAGICIATGLLTFAYGCYLETRNPRTNLEDDIAWLVLGIGVSLGSFGIALRLIQFRFAVVVAVVAPFVAFVVAVAMFWSLLIVTAFGNRHHQDFAANGVSQIHPAKQMEELFDDCRHYITYGANNVTLFNSVAYFGDRYELVMQVPVKIESKANGAMVGKPQFYLNEISVVTVSPSGQVGASLSSNRNFGASEWKQVYHANGDFSAIGFDMNPTPVSDFQKYTDSARPSN